MTGRMLFGLIIIVVGVFWTLESLGLMSDASIVLRWWPALLMLFGVVRLTGIDGHRHVMLGAVALGVGSWLLADTIGLVDVNVFRLWPVALVIVGLAMVSRAMGGRSPFAGIGVGIGRQATDRVDVFSFWSGINRKPDTTHFEGGEITAVMGASEIDLRSAETPEDGADLDLFVWMGGVEILVPKHMRVINDLTVVMGGIEDHRETPAQNPTSSVRLRGVVIWGGVEIKG